MKLLVLALSTILTLLVHAQSPQLNDLQQAQDLYLKGLQAQKDNRMTEANQAWNQAIDLYTKALNTPDFDNAALRFNLGNAYLARQDLGMAIHQYRTALDMDPDNPNTLHNLELARQQRKDELKQPETHRVLQTLFAFHYELSQSTRKWCFHLAYALCFIAIILRILLARRTALTIVIACTAVIATAFGASLLATHLQARQPRGVIVAKVVHAKSGNSNSYQDAFEAPLHDGTEFRLLKKDSQNQWLNIELENGQACWIPASTAILP